MRLRLSQSVINDFKGYKSKQIDYAKGNVTEIKGRNEQGKTTIADAFYNVFAKRDYALNSNPNIRPKDLEDSIPTVTHICDVDGKEISFTSVQKMSRGKEDKNKITLTNSYEVNSVPKNETTFTEYLKELGLDVNKFLALSHPDYFMGNKQDDMRKVIFEMGTAKTDLDIAMMNIDTADVGQLLLDYKMEEVEAMNKATIKKINDNHGVKGELTEMAIVSKQELLVEMDIAEVELQKKALNDQIAVIDKKIADSSAQSKEVSELGQRELRLEFDKNDISRKAHDEVRIQKRNIENSFLEADANLSNVLSKISANEHLVNEKQFFVSNSETEKQRLLTEWQTINDSVFDESAWVFDDSSTVCNMCGQTLPNDKIEDLRATFEANKATAKEKFAADKSKMLADIVEAGTKEKNSITKLNEEIATLEKENASLKEESEKYLAEENKLKADLESFTDDVDMTKVPEYQQKLSEIEDIRKKLASLENNDNFIAELTAEKEPLLAELKECESNIAKFSRNADIEEQIEELKQKRIDYEQARADAEKILHQCKLIQQRKDILLTDEINSHFQFVKWRLFEYPKKGGDETKKICVPYLFEDGIEKSFNDSMSGGTKIRAKIDICYSLQKFYNMFVPIFVDEANQIDRDKVPNVDTQIILLSRADCDLTIS